MQSIYHLPFNKIAKNLVWLKQFTGLENKREQSYKLNNVRLIMLKK